MIAGIVTVFHQGRILIEDTMENVLANPVVREVYLGAGRLIRWLQLLLRQILAQLAVPAQLIPGGNNQLVLTNQLVHAIGCP